MASPVLSEYYWHLPFYLAARAHTHGNRLKNKTKNTAALNNLTAPLSYACVVISVYICVENIISHKMSLLGIRQQAAQAVYFSDLWFLFVRSQQKSGLIPAEPGA